MNRRTIIIIIGAIGVIGVIAAGWYFGSPLFLDDTVDEAFPFEAPSETQIADMTESERMALEKEFVEAVPDAAQLAALPAEELEAVADDVESAAAVVMMDKPMDEENMPEAADEWTVIQKVHLLMPTTSIKVQARRPFSSKVTSECSALKTFLLPTAQTYM